jgi:hypothetical protein
MKRDKITRDNGLFFVVTVGMCLGLEYFAQAVLDSFTEDAQFSTDIVGAPGYIRVCSSSIRNNKWEKCRDDFVEKVKNGLLARLTYEFNSAIKVEGDLAEKVVIWKDGYIFYFHIGQYERDADHGFEIIEPEDINSIPDDEKLGRVVYLTITSDG